MPNNSLNRATLAEQVADAILDQIYTDSIKPGDSLPSTMKLATDFDVSRIVIREALKTLEGKGVIEVSNGRNATVKSIDSESLRVFFEHVLALENDSLIELLEVRRGVEIQSVGLAALRRTGDEMKGIRALVQKMDRAVDSPLKYAQLDLELHLAIATASHNKLIYYLVESIRGALKSTIIAGLRSDFRPEKMVEIQAIHVQICECIAAQNVHKAEEAMAAHFDYAIKRIALSANSSAKKSLK